MEKTLRFFNVWACLITILSAQTAPAQVDNAKKSYPRVVIRLMVEDKDGNNQWHSCVIKTEELGGTERAWNLVKWARCETVIGFLLYRFAITQNHDIPSSFYFYAVQLPDKPNHPPSFAQLSGILVPPIPERSGRIEWRLSHHDPYFFVMYITPFADDASLQKWDRGSLAKNHQLTLTIGPLP